MASRESGSSSVAGLNPSQEQHSFPHFPSSRSDAAGGAPSIISSRMTDIMSDDAGETEAVASIAGGAAGDRSSRQAPRAAARTSQLALRHGLSGRRSSAGGSSTSGSAYGGRPVSSTSRSHVPSLTSHAFFHPMSSQKLQAQRGAMNRPRQSQLAQQHSAFQEQEQDQAGVDDTSLPPSSAGLSPLQIGQQQSLGRPISQGSELTELETVDRRTMNTSPTTGHYASASLTESVRPLQRNQATMSGGGGVGAGRAAGLTVRVDKALLAGAAMAGQQTPVRSPRTPRTFRSSFMLPGKSTSGAEATGANRDMQGGEKLESVASTPQRSMSATSRTHNGTQEHEHEHWKPASTDRRKLGSDSGITYAGKNYEYFLGNTAFCLGGRLENTKSRPFNVLTGTLVVIPAILFFAFSAPWLWHDVSPAIPITFAYVFYICVSSFLHASVSDPGILPRNLHQFPVPGESDDPLRLGPPTTDWVLIKSAESATAAMEVPVKYCRTCNVWRPPRAHHCRVCDNCVETADHHCVWLNNCVGRRNYRYFFTFVTSGTLLALYLTGASLAQILVYRAREHVSFGAAINHFRVPFAMVLYGVLASAYPLALVSYHVVLMARGETTREFLNAQKFPKKDRYRSYTQKSVLRNWVAVLCRPRPPTYYQFKSPHMVGDQRLGARPTKEVLAALRREGGAPRPAKDDALEMHHVAPEPARAFQGPVTLRN